MKIANKQNNTKKSLLVLSFTVLIYLSSFFHISPEIFGFYNFAQYPIVLQNMFAVLAGVLLGGTQGAGAVGLYLVLGALGLPLFSKSALIQTQGFERLSGESGGFLVAYFIASLVSGLILKNPKNEKQDIKKIIKATVLGYALIWLLGLLQYLHIKGFQFSLSAIQTVYLVLIQPYIIFDIIKVIITVFLAFFLRPKFSSFFPENS
ncbi:MAG TPA: biotin transporter BioY [Treponemataceae bacterium]|jgi:biotin transport system substrate-specific component|nr:biotin transporter BioY [Treponemataceae bacterium]HQC26059.1 biotin transporter BioY [Treponemataceae bacterium]HUH44916.1 biotin transporter BioY [Treponemataceae bacterium]